LKSDPVPVPIPADATLTPGAITSGFGAESGFRGPPDVKLAASWSAGVVTWIPVRVTDPPSAATNAAVSALCTPRNGIVTLCCSPVSGFEVIGPSNGGKPAEVLIITTAASPASTPKTARETPATGTRTGHTTH